MHSFLVSVLPDIISGPDVLEIVPETSIGIDDVRGIQSFLSRKPLQSDKNVVLIHSAEKLTLPAQQALLKTLEEPPGNSQIYLITIYPDQLLPTILSRVQQSDISTHPLPDSDQLIKSQQLLNRLLSAKGVGERLKLFDESAFTRESALEFLDHLENILHLQLLLQENQTIKSPEKLHELIHLTRKYLKANVNLKLALDHFAISL